jgi:DUF1365 family protein
VAVGDVDERGHLHAEMPKALHVSPFMPMDQTYRLTCTPPGPRIWFRLETFEDRPDGEPTKVFDADLAVRREPLTRSGLARHLCTHPFATYRVWVGIHAHAVALAARRSRFFPHPGHTGSRESVIGADQSGKVDPS